MSTYNIVSQFHPQVLVLPVEVIDRYLAKANPVFVKVYLYALRLSQFGIAVSCEDLAGQLGLLESDVTQAFSYWETAGLLKTDKEGADIRITLLQPSEQNPQQKPVYKSKDIAAAVSEDSKLRELFDFAQCQLGKPLTPKDCELLYGIVDWLGLAPEVIMVIFNLAVARKKQSMSYVERVAIEWHRNGIDTIEKAEQHLKELEDTEQLFYQFRKLTQVGSRRLTALEQEYVLRWTNEYIMSMEMLRIAYEQTVLNTGKLAFPYMDKILKNWHEAKVYQPADIDRVSKKKTGGRAKTNRFINYQDEHQDFSDVEASALKRRRKKEGGDPVESDQ